jgi:hypothetical protein
MKSMGHVTYKLILGPLTIEDASGRRFVIGVTSFTMNCGESGKGRFKYSEHPGVWARTSAQLEWINGAIDNSECAAP